MNKRIAGWLSVALLGPIFSATAKQVLEFKPQAGDMTPVVRAALEQVSDSEVKLVFAKGTYQFKPDYAAEKYCFITNHGNGLKRIVFRLEGLDSVEIEGNDSEFIFHGQVLPFLFEKCGKIRAKDLTLDWDIPFCIQGEVMAVNPAEGWRDLKMFTKGYSWKLINGRLTFPNIDGFAFADLGSTLAFDPVEQRVAHGAWDAHSRPERVEKRKGGVYRFHEKMKNWPAVGTVVNFKGAMNENRYAPAFHVKSSRNIRFEGITIHHALGMGFLMERSEDAVISGCGIHLREGSDRVVSIVADATHFCNCKGDIVIEDCRFENMLDDGTNVHGTYMEVDQVLDAQTVRLRYGHQQQLGFEFAAPGEEMWFIQQPSPSRGVVGVVAAVKPVNDSYIELRFKSSLPKGLKPGDILENKTWNPTFTMRGCTIRDHRARNIIVKTPKKILIEDNDLSAMMSVIQLRGETYHWYESGAVEDVVIRNNRINYCAYSGAEHAVLYVTPRLSAAFDATALYDGGIVFENNVIETFDNRIVWADRVDGLIVRNNTIRQVGSQPQLYPNAPAFDLINCRNVEVSGNEYMGKASEFIRADKVSSETLTDSSNSWISISRVIGK